MCHSRIRSECNTTCHCIPALQRRDTTSRRQKSKSDTSDEQNRTLYLKKNNFTVNDKIRLMTGVRDGGAKPLCAKAGLLDQSTKKIEKTAFDEAFDEILDTDPDLHDAYLRLISEALKRSRAIGGKKPRGS